jgi:hypothetical protein
VLDVGAARDWLGLVELPLSGTEVDDVVAVPVRRENIGQKPLLPLLVLVQLERLVELEEYPLQERDGGQGSAPSGSGAAVVG